jgi:hypothetical protein
VGRARAGGLVRPVTGTEGAIPQKLSGTRTHSCEHSGKWHGSVHRRGTPGSFMVWATVNLSGSVTEGALPIETGDAVLCDETEERSSGKPSDPPL